MTIKSLLTCIAIALSFSLTASFSKVAYAQVSAGKSVEFIRDLGKRAIDSLTKSNLSESERRSKFRSLLDEAFDVDEIALNALGSYKSQLKAEQKGEYIELFRKKLEASYFNRFKEYPDAEFVIKGEQPQGKNVVVKSTLKKTKSENPAEVEWIVGNNKILDVKVEGISMLNTQRDDFNAVISQNGGKVDALVEKLREKYGN